MRAGLKPTKQQMDRLLQYHHGVGLLMYHHGPNSVTYTEFFIKNGRPHYIKSGTPVIFEFQESDE